MMDDKPFHRRYREPLVAAKRCRVKGDCFRSWFREHFQVSKGIRVPRNRLRTCLSSIERLCNGVNWVVPRKMIFVPEAMASGFLFIPKEECQMNKPELVSVSDCSLMQAEDRFELSFREKIELCRLIDKLGVTAIDLCPIRNGKIDSLLVKSICSAVRNAKVAVPVDLMDDDSVRITWDALKEAQKPKLQVDVPVSSVQMEYLLHIKNDAMIGRVKKAVEECRKYTDDVEFIARDATRSDASFLISILTAAIESGATTVTLCDTAGVMMPEEISAWLDALVREQPLLEKVTLGFFCSGELNMADACAVSSIRSGVREIKASTCCGSAISLSNIIRILNVKGGSLGVFTRIGVEQIRRITSQVGMICSANGRKRIPSELNEDSETSDMILSVHDTIETVMHAAEKLGYDLSAEDQQKVWQCFCSTAEKKEQITLRELDAIIAAEAMQVPPAYHDIHYVINTGNEIGAMSRMKLKFHDQEIEGIASGDGAIDAAFNSIEQATGRHFELDDFQIRSVTEGREAMGETVVRLRWEGKLYSGRGISTDIVGAGIMAYLNAVNKIVYEEEEA